MSDSPLTGDDIVLTKNAMTVNQLSDISTRFCVMESRVRNGKDKFELLGREQEVATLGAPGGQTG